MTRRAHLWAVGFDGTERAAQVRDEIARIALENHELSLLDVAVVVRCMDGSLTLNREPFLLGTRAHGNTVARFLAGLALAEPPMTGAAVDALLAGIGATANAAEISDDFVREVESMIRPGTSALFVLDEERNLDNVLRGIRGLGGRVLKTNVDLQRARLVQSTLSAGEADTTVAGGR